MHRRRLLLMLGALAVPPAAVVRAQTSPAPAGACSVGFVNGLLQFGPDCPLLTSLGGAMPVAPPSHLAMPVVDATAAQTAADEAAADDLARVQAKRDKKRNKKARRGDRQREKRRRATEHKQRKGDHRREKRARKNAPPVPTPTPTPTPTAQAATPGLVNG